jgi:phosphoenolpyruvate synthase/pyruvate phosphate dikinase
MPTPTRYVTPLRLIPNRTYVSAAPHLLCLKVLAAQGLPVAETLVSTRELYKHFLRQNRILSEVFEAGILRMVRRLPGAGKRLRISLANWELGTNPPEVAAAVFRNSPTDLRNGLESMLRHWGSERAVAYRLTYGASSTVFPVIAIQKFNGDLKECHSRHPSTGETIHSGNFDSSLANSVPTLSRELLRMVTRAESALRQPITLLVSGRPAEISAVSSESMLDSARLRAELESLRSGTIGLSEALRRIALLSLVSGYTVDAIPPSISVSGLPAAGGVAIGNLRIKNSNQPDHHFAGGIFCTTAVTPEDLPAILASAAVVTLRGGVSSHAAQICRGQGKACVVGLESFDIDFGRRVLIGPDGDEVPDGTFCLVDGIDGRVIFAIGGQESLKAKPRLNDGVQLHLVELKTVVASAERLRKRLGVAATSSLVQLRRLVADADR